MYKESNLGTKVVKNWGICKKKSRVGDFFCLVDALWAMGRADGAIGYGLLAMGAMLLTY